MDFLTTYDRKDGFQPDWKEKLGNLSLGALRLAFGKVVKITYRGEIIDHFPTSSQKAIGIAALILLSPIFIFAIPVGIIATRFSTTYGKKLPVKPYVPGPDSPLSKESPEPAPEAEPEKKADPTPSPEPVKKLPKFGLTDEQIDLINKGENLPLNARFATFGEIRDYIRAYKDKMDVLWIEGMDFTSEEDLFKNHKFNTVHLNNCKITGQQVAQLSGVQSSGHAPNEVKLTNGTLNKDNAPYFSIRWAEKIDLSNNNLKSDDINLFYATAFYKELILSGNEFDGKILRVANNTYTLKKLDLSNNKINDADLIQAKDVFKIPNLAIDLSNNLITGSAIEELAKTVELNSFANLKVTSSLLDERTLKKILIASAKDNKQKGTLLQKGYTPQEIGITKAFDLSSALVFCDKVETLDVSGIDLSRPEYVNSIINNRSVFAVKHLKLTGCNLTERGLQELARLDKLETLNLDQNPAIDETVVKACFDGEIPPFVINISPAKLAPSHFEVEGLNLKIRELEEKSLQMQTRIFEIRLNLFNYYVNIIESLKDERKNSIRFNISKRFGFEFTQEQAFEIDNCLDTAPFNKDKLIQLILSSAKCKTIEDLVRIKIDQPNEKFSAEKYIIENENLFVLKGLNIDEQLSVKIDKTAKLSARIEGLSELLAISENEIISTMVNTEKKLGQNSSMTHEQLIDAILNVLTYTDLDKEELKRELLNQKSINIEQIQLAICKAANIKSIISAYKRERFLPVVIKL